VPLDVLMPELDGYQVLVERIRSDPSRSGTGLMVSALEYVETLNAARFSTSSPRARPLP
jgi:CheY-like chemotaxis protein